MLFSGMYLTQLNLGDFFNILLGVKVEKPAKMPEHRKISTKTPKVKSSALKRTENADNVSLASSDGRFCQSIA